MQKIYYLLILFLFIPNFVLSQQNVDNNTDRQIENIVSLAKIIGVTKYFHPSEQAVKNDWDKFTLFAIDNIKEVKTQKELATNIANLFSLIAPTMQIYYQDSLINNTNITQNIFKTNKITYWQHRSLGLDHKNLSLLLKIITSGWKSKLITTDTSKTDKYTPNPQLPDEAKISENILCKIPIAFYLNKNTKQPKTKTLKFSKIKYSIKTEQIAAVITAWNIYQHFFLYFNSKNSNWESCLKSTLKKCLTTDTIIPVKVLLQEMISNVNDRHFLIFTKKEFGFFWQKYNEKPSFELSFAENKVVVANVYDSCCGLRKGDVIKKINGKFTDSIILSEIKYSNGSNLLNKCKSVSENLIFKYKGKNEFEIQRNDSIKRFNINLKDKIIIKEPAKFRELEKGYYYIDITLISRKDVKKLIPLLKYAKGIVCDIRYRCGSGSEEFLSHIISDTILTGRWFIPHYQFPNRDNIKFELVKPWNITPQLPKINVPVVFITGFNCLSYGETILEMIKHYKLGTLIGEYSAGTNGDINSSALFNNICFTWTGLYVVNRDDSPLHGIGIKPDINIEPTVEAIKNNDDYLVNYAIYYLKNKELIDKK